MDRGILIIVLLALAWGGLANACRRAADASNIETVDSLITTVDAAILTLNELDPQRFERAAIAFTEREAFFEHRFKDTLDRHTAEILGDQFIALRHADTMAYDHMRTLDELQTAAQRLRALRIDVMNAAMSMEEERNAIEAEERVQELLHDNVEQAIANYRTVQRSWDLLPQTDSLLASGPRETQNN